MTKDFSGIPPTKIYNPTTQTYQVVYLETNQEVNQVPLSPAAGNKIIRKWGGDYVSARKGEINPGYGPMPNDGCCNSVAKYSIYLSLTGEYSFKQSGASFTSCEISGEVSDLSNVSEWLKKLKGGEITIVKGSDRDSECIKQEDYFKADLKYEISEIKKMDHYGYSRKSSISRP